MNIIIKKEQTTKLEDAINKCSLPRIHCSKIIEINNYSFKESLKSKHQKSTT